MRLSSHQRCVHAHDGPDLFSEAFRDAMSRFPSGVTVVTTSDSAGCDWGFTASAFCSLSLTPPLVLVCLANSADSHGAFLGADQWVVNILAEHHADLAMRFATKGVDKFSGGEFAQNEAGLPVLRDAAVSLVCEAYDRHPAGDHTILVGEVVGVGLSDRESLVHYARRFPGLSP